MSQATMTTKGQLTIPKEIRDRLRLKAGDRIEFAVGDRGEIVMTKQRKYDIADLFGMLSAEGVSVDRDAMRDAAIGAVVEKVMKR